MSKTPANVAVMKSHCPACLMASAGNTGSKE